MAKAKYKIGTLVAHQNADGKKFFSEVTAVVTRNTGYEYEVTGDHVNGVVEESEIVNAYKPVATRTRSPKTKKRALARATTEDARA